MRRSRWPVAVSLVFAASLAQAQGRPPRRFQLPNPRPPAPEGRQIETADGDTVIVTGDDRVTVLRRRQAEVRVVATPAQRTVLVMADWGTPGSPAPDGTVDQFWMFREVQGDWPFDARWQGTVTIVEPEAMRVSASIPATLILETGSGRVMFATSSFPMTPADGVTVIQFQAMSGGGQLGGFDEAEREAVSGRNRSGSWTSWGGGGVGFANEVVTGGTFATADPAGAVMPMPGSAPRGAPRTMPRPVHRVQPAWPDPATQPGLRGVVSVRVSVGADGLVKDVAVLRGMPGLDDAAVTAARQWRFEPTGADNQAFMIVWPYPLAER